MKKLNLFYVFLLGTISLGCSNLSTDVSNINQFSLENFKTEDSDLSESIYLACVGAKPIRPQRVVYLDTTFNPLIIKATFSNKSLVNNPKEHLGVERKSYNHRSAYFIFDIKLKAQTAYVVKRQIIDKDKLSVWIEEKITGNVISEPLSAKLQGNLAGMKDTLKQCKTVGVS